MNNTSLIPIFIIDSFKKLILTLNTCTYIKFTIRTINNKVAYAIVAVIKEKDLTIKFVQKITKLLYYK